MQLNGIGEGGLNEVLVRRLAIAGGSAPATAVEPAIFPTLTLESDRTEWGYRKGELRYARGRTVAAGGAALRSSVHLINTRPDSLLVVERILCSIVGTVEGRFAFYGLNILPFGTALTGVALDTRNASAGNVSGRSGALVIEDNTLGVLTTSVFASSATTFDFPQQIVLSPGWALYLSPSADNLAFGYNLSWRERQAESGELV